MITRTISVSDRIDLLWRSSHGATNFLSLKWLDRGYIVNQILNLVIVILMITDGFEGTFKEAIEKFYDEMNNDRT